MKTMKLASSHNEILQKYVDEYFSETGKESATTKEIAIWAIKTDRWDPPADLMLQKCREEFSKAMREQYIRGSRGEWV